MSVVIVDEAERGVVDFGRDAVRVFELGGGGDSTEWCVSVVNNVPLNVHEVDYILIPVVEVVSDFAS